jgi:hypothetical protein
VKTENCCAECLVVELGEDLQTRGVNFLIDEVNVLYVSYSVAAEGQNCDVTIPLRRDTT